MFMNFSQKKMLKQFWIIFKRVENYDGSKREQYSGTQRKARTAANVCNVNDIIFSQKRAIIHQATQLKHLGLCSSAYTRTSE